MSDGFNHDWTSPANAASFAKTAVDLTYDGIKEVVLNFLKLTDGESNKKHIQRVSDRFSTLYGNIHSFAGELDMYENSFDGPDAEYVVEKYKEIIDETEKILEHYEQYCEVEGAFDAVDDDIYDWEVWEEMVLVVVAELKYLGVACAVLIPSEKAQLREKYNNLSIWDHGDPDDEPDWYGSETPDDVQPNLPSRSMNG
ncbi:unnamed protein product [Penicillium bialowiezense]